MVLVVMVPLLFLFALVFAVVYFTSHDVKGQIERVESALMAGPDENPGSTHIFDEAGGRVVEKKAKASTSDSDGEIDKLARLRGCAAWIRERLDVEGLITKFKILLVLYQVGIPQTTHIGLTAA
jgi:hypothetical protein